MSEQEEARKALIEHIKADIERGGHCEIIKKSATLEEAKVKHERDHRLYGSLLRHKHDRPKQLTLPK